MTAPTPAMQVVSTTHATLVPVYEELHGAQLLSVLDREDVAGFDFVALRLLHAGRITWDELAVIEAVWLEVPLAGGLPVASTTIEVLASHAECPERIVAALVQRLLARGILHGRVNADGRAILSLEAGWLVQ